MQLMQIARQHGYDTCPIGGFKHEELAEALSIDKKRYKPVMILSIGKRAENGYHSVRLDPNDVTTWL
jgi:nitroreductase